MKLFSLAGTTATVLFAIFLATGCGGGGGQESATPASSFTFTVRIETERGFDAYPQHDYSFEVSDTMGNRHPVTDSACGAGGICRVAARIDAGTNGKSFLVTALDHGNYVGYAGKFVLPEQLAGGVPPVFTVSPSSSGVLILYKLSKLTGVNMYDLASQLMQLWGITDPTLKIVAERISAYAVTSQARTPEDVAAGLAALLGNGAAPATRRALNESSQAERAEPRVGGRDLAPWNWNWLNNHQDEPIIEGEHPVPTSIKVFTTLGNFEAMVYLVGIGYNMYTAIEGIKNPTPYEADFDEIIADLTDIETQLTTMQNELTTLQNLLEAEATTQNDVELYDQFTQVQADYTNFVAGLAAINEVCRAQTDPNDPDYTETAADIKTCLKSSAIRATDTNSVESYLDKVNSSYQTSLNAISHAFGSNTSTDMSGDLSDFLFANYAFSGLLQNFTFESVWTNGPYLQNNLYNVNAIAVMNAAVAAYSTYKQIGDYIIATYPNDLWSKRNKDTWDALFTDSGHIQVIQKHFSLDAQQGFYYVFSDNTLYDRLSDSSIATFNPQGNLSFGTLTDSSQTGTCTILDYDKVHSAMVYQCDSLNANPFHLLILSNCVGYVGSGTSNIDVWYVNATGQSGDGFLACNDTNVASLGSAANDSSSQTWASSAGHPYCAASSSDTAVNYYNRCGMAEMGMGDEDTYTIYSNTGNHPSGIMAQTSGNLNFNSGDGFSLWDGGTDNTYAAMIPLVNGGMFELVHNYLGSDSNNNSELWLRCPFGFNLDCRAVRSTSSYFTYDNPVVIAGTAYWLSHENNTESGDYSAYCTCGGSAGQQCDSEGNLVDSPAYLASRQYDSALTASAAGPNLVPGSFFPDLSADADPNDPNGSSLYTGPYGTQFFAAGSLTLQQGDAVRVRHSSSMGYQLIMQTDGNLVLYQCTDSNCAHGFSLWASGTSGNSSAAAASFTSDGFLKLLDSSGGVVKTVSTNVLPGTLIALQDDGNLVIYEPIPITPTSDPSTTNPKALPNPYGNGSVWSSGTSTDNKGTHGWIEPYSTCQSVHP